MQLANIFVEDAENDSEGFPLEKDCWIYPSPGGHITKK